MRRILLIAAVSLSEKLIKRSTRDVMWMPLKPSDGSKDNYGLGWGVGDEGGLKIVGHSGGQQGTSTDFTIAPEQRIGVVVLTNMEDIDASELVSNGDPGNPGWPEKRVRRGDKHMT